MSNSRGKKRLVLDLRGVNDYLPKRKFKYEGLNLVLDMCSRGEYFFTFDLKSGYHHVDIHPDSISYLGFSWGKTNERRFFTFQVLPFGLSTACYVFTKLLHPLVQRWRASGLRVILYIDDGFCVADSIRSCERAKVAVCADLHRAGLVINIPKSQLEPTQVGIWLGFMLDLHKGMFLVPQEKIERFCQAIKDLPLYDRVSVRHLASIVGQIISMGLAVGPVARLRSRYTYDILNQRRSWFDRVRLSCEAREELDFWKNNIEFFNGQPIWFTAGVTRVAYSDASNTGFGGYVVEFGKEVAQGQWSADEARLSSSWRELKAVHNVLEAFAPKLRGNTVKWFTDNQSVKFIATNGSKKRHLQDGACCIFETCMKYALKLEMEWVPRSQNERADYISRIVDFDDWKVNPCLFHYLDGMWGPHTVDCFASYYNTQLSRYFSRYWNPGADAVDAFTVDWSYEVCWWVPPLYLVMRVVKHARACAAKGTLIVPCWKSAPFCALMEFIL